MHLFVFVLCCQIFHGWDHWSALSHPDHTTPGRWEELLVGAKLVSLSFCAVYDNNRAPHAVNSIYHSRMHRSKIKQSAVNVDGMRPQVETPTSHDGKIGPPPHACEKSCPSNVGHCSSLVVVAVVQWHAPVFGTTWPTCTWRWDRKQVS